MECGVLGWVSGIDGEVIAFTANGEHTSQWPHWAQETLFDKWDDALKGGVTF
jgi:hypothetical protein